MTNFANVKFKIHLAGWRPYFLNFLYVLGNYVMFQKVKSTLHYRYNSISMCVQ